MAKQTLKKALSFIMAFCMIISLFTCMTLVPASAAGTTPDLIKFKASASYSRLQYTKGWSTIKAGNYRFEMDCIIYSGTPVIRVGADETGALSSWQSNYVSTYDEANHKYIITFTVASDWAGNLGVMVGNNGTDGTFDAANPALYLLDANGNPTGSSLINTFASDYYSTSRAGNKWNRRAPESITFTSPVPDGYFEPEVVEPIKSDLVEISGDINATNRLDYTKAWSTIKAGNYRFEMDCKIFSGTPIIRVGADATGALESWQSNYVATYDEVNHKYIITFTVANDWSGNLGVRVGNYYNSDIAHIAVANPTLYLLDADGNPTGESLINTFASDYYSTSRVGDKWNRPANDKMTCSELPDNYFAPTEPHLVEIPTSADYTRFQYTKSYTTIKAGNYRFEMDCKIFSGTPIIRVGADATGNLASWQSNYVATYDEANRKYIITFTVAEDTKDYLGALIGNYGQSDLAHFAFANPTLYLLDAEGNNTGKNLINTFASDYYSDGSRAADKWDRRAHGSATFTTPIPGEYFDPAPTTTGKPYMAIFPQGQTWTLLEYNDAYLALCKGKTYTFTVDERDVIGTPTLAIYDADTNSIKNYASSYTDEKNGNIRTITFTMNETVKGVKIRLGNYTGDVNTSVKYADVKLVESGSDANLIAGFSSDTMASARENRKWFRGSYSTSGNFATFYTTAIPEGYFENELTDKMFYISEITTNASYGNTIVNTGAVLAPGTTYIVELDWKAHAGLDPALRATYKNTDGSWKSLGLADFVSESGHYTATFTMPEDAVDSSIVNFQLGLGADIKNDDFFHYGKGAVYFGNFSVKADGSDLNLLINSDLKFADQGDFTGTVAWNIGVDKNNGSRDMYGDLLVLDQPEGFFTDEGAAAEKMVKFNGGSYDYIRQTLVLKPATTYRLTYRYAFVNAGSTQYIQVVDTANEFTTVTYDVNNFDTETRTRTLEFTTPDNLRDFDNAVLSFLIEANAPDVSFNFADVKLYEIVDGETVGANIINNGGFYFGDEITLDNLQSDVKDDRSTNTLQLLGWTIYGTFEANESIQVVKITEDAFAAVIPSFAERLVNLRQILLGKKAATNSVYEDFNGDGKVDLKDLVATKKAAAEGYIPNGADDEAYDWKLQNLSGSNATDTSNITGTIYYVDAVNGNDNNDGKSLSKVNNKSYSNGDAVLFKAGQTWRPSSVGDSDVLETKSGVTYGAYGTGAKPQILGSAKNYATADWTQVSENVWRTDIGTANYSAGIVVYNGGELIGTMTKTRADLATANIGDFCHYEVVNNVIDETDRYVYVNCPENPANYWDDIEIGVCRSVVNLVSNVTVDNLAVMYTGYHGLDSGAGVSNITIQNCVVSYIGGSYNDINRLGNGIQFGISGENLTVKDCYVSECYDAGITFQTWESLLNGNGYWRNLTFTNNLVENCNYAFEWFAMEETPIENIIIDSNIFRGAGYGWSYDERVGYGEDLGTLQVSLFRVGTNAYYSNITNFQITNNIFDRSKKALIYWWWNSSADIEAGNALKEIPLTISGNSFYQEKNADNLIMVFNNEGHTQGISTYGVLEALKKFEGTDAPTGNAEAVIGDNTIFVQ